MTLTSSVTRKKTMKLSIFYLQFQLSKQKRGKVNKHYEQFTHEKAIYCF